jgi:hypothetical protein
VLGAILSTRKRLLMSAIYKLTADDFRQAAGPRPCYTLAAAMFWVSVIAFGMACMLRYANAPGGAGMTPVLWPAGSRIALETNRPTLIVFAHPRCPCTRASIGELDQLMADCQGRFGAQVWFIKPAGVAPNWTDTDLWAKAAAIPGVTVHRDDDGIEARRFQAETSGQSVLYDQTGKLLFHGGITISRGHAGDNPGVDALKALLTHKVLNQAQTPVFGCSLFGSCTNQQPTGAALEKQKT